jgi:hypothetical protein
MGVGRLLGNPEDRADFRKGNAVQIVESYYLSLTPRERSDRGP